VNIGAFTTVMLQVKVFWLVTMGEDGGSTDL